MTDSAVLESSGAVVRKVMRRIVPILVLVYVLNFLDRVNIGYAALTMNADLKLSEAAFGFGAGIFFLGYSICEVPSNLVMHRIGAPVWLSRIIVSWGLISAATAFIHGATSFLIVRALLGIAEAGLFPGIILYLSYWVPAAARARVTALFFLAIPLSQVLGAPVSTLILQHADGWLGVAGWRWMFLWEGLPSVAVGAALLFLLPDRPSRARWLSPRERDLLAAALMSDDIQPERAPHGTVRAVLTPPVLRAGLSCFALAYGTYALSFFLPQLVNQGVRRLGANPSLVQIGELVALVYLVAMMSMWWWARRSDRLGERTWHVAGPALAAAVLGGPVAAVSGSPYALFAVVLVLAVAVFAALPPFWSVPPELLRGRALAVGVALINSFGSVGGFLAGLLTGWLGSFHHGFRPGLAVACAVMIVPAVAGFSWRRRGSHPPAAPTG